MNTDTNITGTSSSDLNSIQDEYKDDPVTGLPFFALKYTELSGVHFHDLLIGKRSHGNFNFQVEVTRYFFKAIVPQPAETPEARAMRWFTECKESQTWL